MVKENYGGFGDDQSSVTLQERLSKYVANWPLFLVIMVLSVGAGFLYIRYTVPKYIATTQFLIKGQEGGGPVSNDLIESTLQGKREVNLNNEMLLLSSARLMQRTVAKNDFNVTYFKKGRILDIEIYKDAPFILTALPLIDSNSFYQLYIKTIDLTGGTILYGPEKNEKLFSFQWNKPFKVRGQGFILTPNRAISPGDGEYLVMWKPVAMAAGELSANFIVKAVDTKTSVIQLTIKTENVQKGKDL